MNHLKFIKGTDILINVVLIGWFVTHFFRRDPDSLLTAYLMVGGWQVVSMVLHEVNKWFTVKYNTRYLYHRISLVAILTMPLGSIWILGAAAPFMAIFYTVLCMVEFLRIKKRPLNLV